MRTVQQQEGISNPFGKRKGERCQERIVTENIQSRGQVSRLTKEGCS